MDPLSQGVLGAALPQSFSKNKHLLAIFIIGFLSGIFPDIDIFFRSKQDPLMFLEYHRQFTHSLIFIPIGSFIFSVIYYNLFKKIIPFKFKKVWVYAMLGYGTHGILDACTSYGTQLLWPFTNERISWNNISIIDPLFTLPILALLILSMVKNKTVYAQIALLWVVVYLIIGVIQNYRAENYIQNIIEERQHKTKNISVKPSFGNLILWKTIYEDKGVFYVDAINLGLKEVFYKGESIKAFNKKDYIHWNSLTSIQKKDVDRFIWFSQNYVAINPIEDKEIIDIRYSNLPNQIGGLWGIEVEPKSHKHVKFVSNRETTRKDFKKFFMMIFNF
jgi:inner membrane protein